MRNMFSRCVFQLAAVFLAALACASPSYLMAQKAAATDSARVPVDFLKTKPVRSGSQKAATAATAKRAANTAALAASVPGIDSLTNWTDQFTAPGYDFNGNPQSVWPYEMVGTAPESGRTTILNAPIIPVTLQLLDKDGSVAVRGGTRLVLNANPAIVNAVTQSPVFQPWIYTSGIGQFNDQMMRAEFHDRIGSGDDDSWHILLNPRVKKSRVMSIPYGFWFYALNSDGSVAFALVDQTTFGNLLFPPTYPVDNSTLIGAAEKAGDMTTRDLTTLLFNNVFLYDGTVDNCCVLGFHAYDFEPGIPGNGNRERRYVFAYASWISNGFFSGFGDVTALSHEISETYNDPFVDNQTPWWLSVDPFTGAGLCQDNLETGDVVEVLSSNPSFAISMNGRTYHPQNEAMFPWFAFQSPSSAHLNAYSFPDETTLTSLSPGPLLPGCKPAP